MRCEIISGGQTGVDRAALDVALTLGLPCGGVCPRGRRAEDGTIPARYPLAESRLAVHAWRTVLNVWLADALLVLAPGAPAGGTRLALLAARIVGRPRRVVDLAPGRPASDAAAAAVRAWLDETGVRVLNVAGPRESEAPGIAAAAEAFLRRVLAGG